MTPGEIIYHRRVRLLELADELGNVSAACRQVGISRTRYYEWRTVVARYGLTALMPKDRRAPQLPNAVGFRIVAGALTTNLPSRRRSVALRHPCGVGQSKIWVPRRLSAMGRAFGLNLVQGPAGSAASFSRPPRASG